MIYLFGCLFVVWVGGWLCVGVGVFFLDHFALSCVEENDVFDTLR